MTDVTDIADIADVVGRQTPRRGRAYRRAAVVVVVVAVIGAVVVGSIGLGGRSDASPAAPVTSTAATATVERQTLVQSYSLDGQIDLGAPEPLLVKATGTITWLPKVGATVRRGETLLRVDDRPVVLLYGSLPQYRALAAAVPPAASDPAGATLSGGASKPPAAPAASTPAAPAATTPAAPAASTPAAPAASTPVAPPASTPAAPPTRATLTRVMLTTGTPTPTASQQATVAPFTGNDVEEFESNLAALGFRGFTVDQEFTAATAEAVKQWQKSLGVPQTGTVGLGDIVYADGPVQIAKVGAQVGADMSPDVISISGTTRSVTADASTTDLAWAKEGTKVSIALSDGTTTPGTVTAVGGVTPSAGQGNADVGGTVPVTVTAAQQDALTGPEGSPVTVTYVAAKKENVLCVPVPALVALAEGGYGLEPAEPGSSRFIAVQTGMFADGLVEVSGPGLREGMAVRVAQ